MIKDICVFASSSNFLDEKYYIAARELGKLIGQNGYNIVYGGSNLGLMWACASQVKENGGAVTGVMPEKLHNMGVFTPECDEFILTAGMRERKAKIDEISQAVIALPGGFGTLEEVSEMIVQKQLGYNKKPIVILNTDGFYDNLIRFFEDMIEEKYANKNMRIMYYVAKTPQDAIEYINTYSPSDVNVDKNSIYAR